MTATVSSPSPRSAPSPDADSGSTQLEGGVLPAHRSQRAAVAAVGTRHGPRRGRGGDHHWTSGRSGALVDKAAFQPGLAAIAGLLAVVEVLAFIRAPLRYAERLVGHDAAFHALSRWRVWLYDSLEPLAPAGLRAWRSGDLLVRAVDDVDALQDLYLRVLTPVVVAVATSVLAVVVVALILPLAGLLLGVALAVALLVPPASCSPNPLDRRARGVASGLARRRRGRAGPGCSELLAFGRHEDYLAGRTGPTPSWHASPAGARRMAAVTSAIVALCVGGAVIGTLASGVDALSHHHLEPIMLAVLPFAAVAAFETVPGVTVAAARLREVLAAGRRLLDLEDVPAPVQRARAPRRTGGRRRRRTPRRPAPLRGGPAVGARRLRPGRGLGWSRCHRGRQRGGQVQHRQRIAAVLAARAGRRHLGGVDIASAASEEVRRAMALVAQEADLFAGTIASNVALARPRADREEIERALRLAQLEAWVHTLPDGVDTPVGERASDSQGASASASPWPGPCSPEAGCCSSNEPTAGLDEPTAAALIADVLAATEGTTVILVTHRSADLAGFSDVVEIEAGRARPR